jgi:hypothetical protein
MKRWISMFVLGAALMLFAPTQSHAETFSFSCITGNSATNCNALEDQVVLDVTADANPNLVNFRFTNTGSSASSITDVYFNDLKPALLGLPSYFTSSSGVSFAAGCSPGNVPGGGGSFGFVTSYCADSNSPTQPNGVNPGEWLNIQYTLQGDATFADVLAALYNETYRVGVHVQGFADGGSEAGVTQVPEPSTLLLAGSGLAFAVTRRRRRA